MKKIFSLKLALILIVFSLSQFCTAQNVREEFSFIVSSDQREHTTDKFHSKEFTLGGYEAIKQVDKGSFMVVLGDMDPPEATHKLIEEVFGKDYPWYPIIGNHDIEKENNLDYLREFNRDNKFYMNLVRKGPVGCEETTYSFDWDDFHFVVLNMYYDGISDKGMDGNIVPELLEWLENDLKNNTKKYVIVFGHEPVYPVLDMDNGTQRHLGDSLDKYPQNSLNFVRLLLKYGVLAYMSGHTHCASYANFNGLWLINSGHIYGRESEYTADYLFNEMSKYCEVEKSKEIDQSKAVISYFNSHKKDMKKFIFNLGLGDGWYYQNLSDEETFKSLFKFYDDCKKDTSKLKEYSKLFWENTEWRQSSFLKITVGDENVKVDIYRDDGIGGNYSLRHSFYL